MESTREKLLECFARIAYATDGAPIAYECSFKKGRAIVFGSFVGQENYRKPVEMHPLIELLAKWSGLSTPKLQAPTWIELRQMYASKGRFVFLFNHGEEAAQVEFTRTLEKPASAIHEIVTGQAQQSTLSTFTVRTELLPQSVKIYRIDY